MSDLNLSEGQEFYIGDQRYVVKDGVPVQEAKRGPLGGELVRFGDLKPNDLFSVQYKKIDKTDIYSTHIHLRSVIGENDLVEINVPQQAKGRVMTAGEAAKLPDIVGKTILIKHSVLDGNGSCRPLITIPKSQPKSDIEWHISERIIVEVLD